MRHPIVYQRALIAAFKDERVIVDAPEFLHIAEALEDALACIAKLDTEGKKIDLAAPGTSLMHCPQCHKVRLFQHVCEEV